MRRLLEGSLRTTEPVRRIWLGQPEDFPGQSYPRVQDAYSFRCIPQVHGAAFDALDYFRRAITSDLNAATDNPLIFGEDGSLIALSGGNFLGIQLAQAADLAATALVKVAQASERRTFRLLNPALSFQLPEQLSGGKPGLNSGLMIAQYSQASLINECAVLASPASIHPAITSGGQEDLASMSLFAVRKLSDIVDRVQTVVTIELLCAVQGVTLTQPALGCDAYAAGSRLSAFGNEHRSRIDDCPGGNRRARRRPIPL
jgi:histidine ammonia-lyase